jgi:hypothetical protein
MFKNLTLLLVSHLLVLFDGFFGSLLEVFLSIVDIDEIINSCFWFHLWKLFQLRNWNFWNELFIFDVEGAWPLVSVMNIKVLKLWVSSFEILEMINHNLNKFHLEDLTSLRLKRRRNRSRVRCKTWLSSNAAEINQFGAEPSFASYSGPISSTL